MPRDFFRAFLFLGLILSACAPIPIPSSGTPAPKNISFATPAPTPTPAYEGGAITIGALADAANAFLQAALYDSLLTPDPLTGALQPALAEAYQVSDDALAITFRLRAGVKWHNGDPFTADDVVVTINAFNRPDFRGTPVADFGTLTKATALDAQTVQLVFREADCPALTYIGTMKIYPRAAVANSNLPRLSDAPMIGTGALKLVARNGTQAAFARNPDYWRGAPHIDDWSLKTFPDARALRAAFTAKQIDLMLAEPRDVAAMQKVTDIKLYEYPAPEIVMLLFNTDSPILSDVRVRQALGLAINRDVLLNDIGDQGRAVGASALPNYWASPQNPAPGAFDSNRAQQLLNEAGWRDNGTGVLRRVNKPLALQLLTEGDDPILEPLAFRLREQFAALGAQVELELNDRPGWLTHAFSHRFDLLLLSRKIPLDPDQHWYWQSDQNQPGDGFNFGSYSSPRADQLFKQLNRAPACAAGARAALFGDIARQLQADAPAAFLIAPPKFIAASDRVLNIAPSAFAGEWWNVGEWRVKQ